MATDRLCRSKPTSPAPSALAFDPNSRITISRFLLTTMDMNLLSSLPAVSLLSHLLRPSTNSKFRWVLLYILVRVDLHFNYTFSDPIRTICCWCKLHREFSQYIPDQWNERQPCFHSWWCWNCHHHQQLLILEGNSGCHHVLQLYL